MSHDKTWQTWDLKDQSMLRWQKAEATLKEDPEVEKLAGVVDVPGKKLENNSGVLTREDRSWRAPSGFFHWDTDDPSTSSSIPQHSSSSPSGLFFNMLTPSYPVDSFSVALCISNRSAMLELASSWSLDA